MVPLPYLHNRQALYLRQKGMAEWFMSWGGSKSPAGIGENPMGWLAMIMRLRCILRSGKQSNIVYGRAKGFRHAANG